MNIILGPPGTGKTTTLLDIMDKALLAGTRAESIGFISFTKRAIREAKERVKPKFNLSETQLVNFRTLHSFAFRYLGLSTKSIMRKQNYQELADLLGIEIEGDAAIVDNDFDINIETLKQGDRLLFLDGVSRNKMQPLKDTWERYSLDDLDFNDVRRCQYGLELYKQQFALLDYTDLLERFIKEDFKFHLDLLLVDEAQDLSTLQWKVLEKIASNCDKVYIAGDDDQAIFRWAGADIEYFINLPGDVTVLKHSYRLSEEVHNYSQSILHNITTRREKKFEPAGHKGSVSYIVDIEELDFSKGQWLILSRSSYNLYRYAEFIKQSGYFFHFKDIGPDENFYGKLIITYLKLQFGLPTVKKDVERLYKELGHDADLRLPWQHSLLKTIPSIIVSYYDSLDKEVLETPRIQLSTIHGAKGTEADNVIICPDISYKAYMEMNENPDDEARVFYVGATRAKENLYILTPQTRYYYEL